MIVVLLAQLQGLTPTGACDFCPNPHPWATAFEALGLLAAGGGALLWVIFSAYRLFRGQRWTAGKGESSHPVKKTPSGPGGPSATPPPPTD